MTEKVQKILSEIATRKLCTMDEHMAFYNDKAKEDYRFLSEIEELIKALQEEPVSEPQSPVIFYGLTGSVGITKEEPVSEDWEKEIEKMWAQELRYRDTDYTIAELTKQDYEDCARHFAQWQKQQLMKDATDVTVHIDAGGYPYIPQMELYDYEKDIPFAKEGDKYKVILIKEE